ncbi:MAG: hypothetical protein JO231_21350 [Acidobacteria bacterium]|nr:hypothetical protein [Acidobacteriota bacterium]
MGIDLLWRGNDESVRDAAYDDSSLISDLINDLRQDRRSHHLLLSTIDPYGNTRFMSAQAGQLLRELHVIRQDSASPDLRVSIGRLISIIRAAEGAADEWLEFVGD